MSELHVIPDQRTTWRIHEADAPVLLSEHTNATEAELVAKRPAGARGAERVVVHDRYHRPPDRALAGPRANARRARARQLDAVRECASQLARQRGTR